MNPTTIPAQTVPGWISTNSIHQPRRSLLAAALFTTWLALLAPFTVSAATNLPAGATLAPLKLAPPVPPRSAAELELEAATVRANLLAATSNTVSQSDSGQRIRAVPGGGLAEFGLLKVFFPVDAAGEDPFRILTPEGLTLTFQPRFLAWHDTSTGERWLLAQVTNRVGSITAPGEVWYTNAFGPDGLEADLRLRYGRLFLEQDLVLRKSPPLPEGARAEDLRLEFWTEWQAPVMRKVTQATDLRRGLVGGPEEPAPAWDEQVSFGAARLGDGYAFSTGDPADKVVVGKTLFTLDGRDWLVEAVDFSALRAKLDALGGSGAKRTAKVGGGSREELIRSLAMQNGKQSPGPAPAGALIETAQRAGSGTNAPALLLAQASAPETPGVVVDFVILACVPAPAGVISWWPAGGNAQDAISTSGNDGTLYNNAAYGPGKVGQGLIFNGAFSEDYVEIPDATTLNPTDGLTVEAWIYFSSNMAGENMPIVSKDGPYGRQYLLTKTWGDVIRAHVGIAGDDFYYTDGEITLTPETWHHVAMTYSAAAAELKIYVDGVPDVNATVSGSLLTTAEPLYLGGAPYYGYYWSGGIDEAAVYDRALSASEIAMLYEAGGAGKINPNCAAAPSNTGLWLPGDLHPYSLSTGHTAALQNGATYAPAVVSSGFSFDGVNDGVTVPHDAALNFGANEDFSVEVWLQARTNLTVYGLMAVFGKRYSPNLGAAVGWELFLIDGKPTLQLADPGGWANYTAPGDVRDGGWHHVVATVDRDSPTGGRIYVDGVQVLQFNPTNRVGSLANTEPVRVGVHPQPGLNAFYKGIIDEPTVFRRALSGTEVGGLYQAGSAGKCREDADNDSLPDWWEMRHFGDLDQTAAGDADNDGLNNLEEYQEGTNPTDEDTDGDGLWDSTELCILLDASNPSLGSLDPLNPDTGATGKLDSFKDGDHDGLGNLSEVIVYYSDPSDPHTFSPRFDSEYFHMAFAGACDSEGPDCETEATLRVVQLEQGMLGFGVSRALPNAAFDLYFVNDLFAQRWQWRRVHVGIQCNADGEATFVLKQPDPYGGYFVILSAEDPDEDGLTSGYECWFTYNGQRTDPHSIDTDSDHLKDGWEVEYGLDPTSVSGVNGGLSDEDLDGANNQVEHDNYYAVAGGFDSTFDPRKAVPAQRPVVTISPLETAGLGFKIKRHVGPGGSTAPLTVYYALGGTAEYSIDYTLDPAPSGLDRIRAQSITGESVDISVLPTPAGLQKGHLSVIVAVTPFAVSPETQVSNPLNWLYALDWNHNRITNYFSGKSLTEGFLINLRRETTTGHLKINSTANTTPLPFVNVAASGRGTVARIEIPNQWNPTLSSPTITAEYYTAPLTAAPGFVYRGDPSRTTVDRYGNVWVANRAIGDDAADYAGSVTKIGVVIGGKRGKKIAGQFVEDPPALPPGELPGEYRQGPFDYNTCVDRDGDRLIHTSYGRSPWDDTIHLIQWNGPILSAGDGDEAITYYLRTTPTYVRSVAVDRDNNVWVGSRDDGWQELIDHVTGAPITGEKFLFGGGGYGAVVDPYGKLWSSGYSWGRGLLRLAPGLGPAGILRGSSGWIMPSTLNAYGVGIDPTTADIWLGAYASLEGYSGGLYHFEQSGCWNKLQLGPADNPSGEFLKGIVADGKGNVWVAHAGDFASGSPGSAVYRIRSDGEYLGKVIMQHPVSGVTGMSPHGVCVDSQSRVWAVCYLPASDGKYYAMRIDPTQGIDPDTQEVVGSVIEAVDLGAFPDSQNGFFFGPYNYSDMTGFVALSATQPSGVWDFVENSGAQNTLWSSITLDAETSPSDSVVVEVRAANHFADLPSLSFKALSGTSGSIPLGWPTIKGQYLEVRVNLLRTFGSGDGPVLRALSLGWTTPGGPLQISTQPKSKTLQRGDNDPEGFSVGATGGTGLLSYQWFRNDDPAGSSSSILPIVYATHTDAGEYFVRITDAAGDIVESARVRLHVNSTPASRDTQITADPNNIRLLGDSVTLDASIDAAPSPAANYYQWRKNGNPIVGASGTCYLNPNDNRYHTLPYTLTSLQCSDAGEYSAVFKNPYWNIASDGIALIVRDANGAPTEVTVSPPGPIELISRTQPPTLTATACFTPVCARWYKSDYGGTSFKELIQESRPGTTGMEYTFPNPVPCSLLWPYGYFMIEIVDSDGVVHASQPVQVYGDCEP